MMWVLTGREEFRSETRALGALITHAKRKKRRAQGFKAPPNRELNKQKKKRQSRSADIDYIERPSLIEDSDDDVEMEENEGEDSGAASDQDDPSK